MCVRCWTMRPLSWPPEAEQRLPAAATATVCGLEWLCATPDIRCEALRHLLPRCAGKREQKVEPLLRCFLAFDVGAATRLRCRIGNRCGAHRRLESDEEHARLVAYAAPAMRRLRGAVCLHSGLEHSGWLPVVGDVQLTGDEHHPFGGMVPMCRKVVVSWDPERGRPHSAATGSHGEQRSGNRPGRSRGKDPTRNRSPLQNGQERALMPSRQSARASELLFVSIRNIRCRPTGRRSAVPNGAFH